MELSLLVVVIAIIILIVVYFIIYNFNKIIRLNNRVDETLSGINVQLKKRYDLIPNLVSAVKAYMVHERGLLEDISALRSRVMSGKLSSNELVEAESTSRNLLRNIMVAVENYPELKSNTNVDYLQRTLNEIESQLSAARRTYNLMVRGLNDAVGMFPTSVFANLMEIRKRDYFEIPNNETQNPNLDNLFNGNK